MTDALAEPSSSTFLGRGGGGRVAPEISVRTEKMSKAKRMWKSSGIRVRAVQRGGFAFGDGLRHVRQHSNQRIADGIKAVSTASSILPLLSMLSFGYATEALLVLDLDLLVGEIPTARSVQVICLATCMLLSVFSITFAVLEFYYIELSSGMHHTSISRFANKTAGSLSEGLDESSAHRRVHEEDRRSKRQLFELEVQLDRAIAEVTGALAPLPKENSSSSSSSSSAPSSAASKEQKEALHQIHLQVQLMRERLHEKDEQAFLKIEYDHLGRLDRVVDGFIGARRLARNAMWGGLVAMMVAVAAKLCDRDGANVSAPLHPVAIACCAILGGGAVITIGLVLWFRRSYRPLARSLGSVR